MRIIHKDAYSPRLNSSLDSYKIAAHSAVRVPQRLHPSIGRVLSYAFAHTKSQTDGILGEHQGKTADKYLQLSLRGGLLYTGSTPSETKARYRHPLPQTCHLLHSAEDVVRVLFKHVIPAFLLTDP